MEYLHHLEANIGVNFRVVVSHHINALSQQLLSCVTVARNHLGAYGARGKVEVRKLKETVERRIVQRFQRRNHEQRRPFTGFHQIRMPQEAGAWIEAKLFAQSGNQNLPVAALIQDFHRNVVGRDKAAVNIAFSVYAHALIDDGQRGRR